MGNKYADFSTNTTANRKDFGLNWNMAGQTGDLLVGDQIKIALAADSKT